MMPTIRWMLAVFGLWLSCAESAFSLPFAANAQPDVTVWGNEQGLPQSSVITMIQTRDGYLWLGTLRGLVRFDGTRFQVFNEYNTPGLKSGRIIKLFEDSQTNLWIGTEDAGVAVMQNGKVHTLPQLSEGGAFRKLSSICEDAQGGVWLFNANGELWRYWHGRSIASYYNPDGSNGIKQVIAERDGLIRIGTEKHEAILGEMTQSSLAPPISQEVELGSLHYLLASQEGGYWRLAGSIQRWKNNRIERELGPYTAYPLGSDLPAVCEDKQGNLLVGTRGAGLFHFGSDGQVTNVTNLRTNEGLSSNLILSLLMDREGVLWVGTDGSGLNRVKGRVLAVVQESSGRTVQSVSPDEDGGVWIASNFGGIDHYQNGHVARFGLANGMVHLNTKSIFVDRASNVWAGVEYKAVRWDAATGAMFSENRAGLFRFNGTSFAPTLETSAIRAASSVIFQDRAGNMWAGDAGGLHRWKGRDHKVFTTDSGLSSDSVRAIAEDTDGNIWVGTADGLNKFSNNHFTVFRKPDGFPSENVSCLYADSDGVLWIGTDGVGLVRYHKGKWTQYTKKEGLVSDSVAYLVEDTRGNLWMGSNLGLMQVPKTALNDYANGAAISFPCRRYGEVDGMPNAECTFGSQPGGCRSGDGKLWFPTVKGLLFVDPKELSINTNPPPVIIESVRVENEERVDSTAGSLLQIAPEKERVEIRYTSLNLSAPEQARFRYRLEANGHETPWTEVGNTRVAPYPKLSPGRYRFQVTACNEDGVWNPTGSSLSFVMLPPFWQTWWFLTAASVFLLAVVVGSVHYTSTQRLQRELVTLRQQEALERERSRIARDIHDQLGANLTQVALLGELVEADKESPSEVEVHGQQISQSARDISRALDEIVWTVNPQNDTLEGLTNYICKYAQEYLAVAGISYRLEAASQLPPIDISPDVRHNVFLAAKEAITNIVKHAKASAVTLRLKLDSNRFAIHIEDNGVGLAGMDKERARTRSGLRNQRERMEAVGGSFEMGPGAEGGTSVRFAVPIQNSKIV